MSTPTLPHSEPTIIHEERHFVVVNKPSGWLSQPDDTDDPCLAQWLVETLRKQRTADQALSTEDPNEKPYNPFVAPVHRLDRPVSGLLVLARTSKAASRLSESFRTKSASKIYLAICHRNKSIEHQTLSLWLTKDRNTNKVSWSPHQSADATLAQTRITPLYSTTDLILVQLQPLTGRSHQLRTAMAFLGGPIVGDLKYGSSTPLGNAIALHAAQLQFPHPISSTLTNFQAPPPPWWAKLFPPLLDQH